MNDIRRSIPAVNTLLNDASLAPLLARASRAQVADAVRDAIAAVRTGVAEQPYSRDEWAALIGARFEQSSRPSLRRVINATGIVLHTNLGRAPLAAAAIEAISSVAAGYSNLEYELDRGTRGSRFTHVRDLLCELTGAEDALVVNNCAAALVLALRALAQGRDVLVSRGELLEIGGAFRIPDIMAQADVRLVEVGTTNRTHLDDYRRALGGPTAAIVKVHRSNFTMDGFVAEVRPADLAALAAEGGIPLLHDFGSGLLMDLSPWGFTGEPSAADIVGDGADVVMMSGDKLLGGPQAGILVGRAPAIAALRAHPFARAVRVDKLTLAALDATLSLYRDPVRATSEIPALAMLTAPRAAVESRAQAIAARIAAFGVHAAVIECDSAVGGGAFPSTRIPSAALQLPGDAVSWDRALRAADTAVVGRIANGAMLLDCRTVLGADEAPLVAAVGGGAS